MGHTDPTIGVVYFTEFLRKKGISSGKVVDIGSGKGRNSAFMAEQGFEVYGLEYIKSANDIAKELAKKQNVGTKVHLQLCDVAKPWKFENDFFDVAIDSYTSIDIETKRGREKSRDEMWRSLKPSGYGLILVVSADDEWERKMIAKYPGPEPNSCIWPQNGKFQKDYDEAELREFYKKFLVMEIKKVNKPVFKLGRNGTSTDLWVILHKS